MRSARQIDRIILELAARNESVVHARDLRALDVDRDHVTQRVGSGFMAPIVGRSYGVGPSCHDPTFRMQCMAGALAAGPGSFVDGETAAVLLDAWNRDVHSIHITTQISAPDWSASPFEFHRARGIWLPAAHRHDGPIPIAQAERMCCQFARNHSAWQLAFVIQRCIFLRLATLASLEGIADVNARSHGNATLRAAIDLVRSGSFGTRGQCEDDLLADMLAAGVDTPIVNTRGCMGMSRDEPDFVWRARRANVEMDGRQHDEPRQAEDDRLRDAEAVQRGWRVLRIRARDFWRARSRVLRHVLHFLDGGDPPRHPNSTTLRLD